MIVLDRFEKWSACRDEQARQYLSDIEYREYRSIPAAERLSQLKAILEKPIACFAAVNEVFFRARWAEVLGAALVDVLPEELDPIQKSLSSLLSLCLRGEILEVVYE